MACFVCIYIVLLIQGGQEIEENETRIDSNWGALHYPLFICIYMIGTWLLWGASAPHQVVSDAHWSI